MSKQISPRPAAGGRTSRHALAVAVLGACALGATAASAEIINATRVHLIINGADVVNVPGGGPNVPATSTGTRNEQGVNAAFTVTVNQGVTSKSTLSGTTAAKLILRGSSAFNFTLHPPAGVASLKGAQLVFHGTLKGNVSDGATLNMVSSVELDSASGTGHGAVMITSSTVPQMQYDMSVTVSPFAAPGDLTGRIRLFVDAVTELDGITSETFSAEATTGTGITGFRVLAADGTPMQGFTMTADGGAIPELGGVPGGGKGIAIEFYHQGFNHYFVSSDPGEIARLDDGSFPGWTRTGEQFNVSTAPGAGLSQVCRFYTVAFPPSSSHFYTANPAECEALKANNKWQYEKIAFYIAVPSAQGVCPAQTAPVFRLFNNGQGGAPNHRFTTSTAIRSEMIGKGYADEGVTMCASQ